MLDVSSIEAACASLRSYGTLAPVIAFILFFIQAVFPIFPYFILAAAAGIIFGFWMGTLLSWLGALLGACFAFWLVRMFGWDWLHNHLYKRYHVDVKQIPSGLGFWAIFLGRIFPVVPTPVINVAAGISGISFWTFFFASALGKLPTAVAFSGLGYHLRSSGNLIETMILLTLVVLIGYLGVAIIRRRGYTHI